MELLTKEETKELVKKAFPIENLLYRINSRKCMDIICEIQLWLPSNGKTANESFQKKRDLLGSLLGQEPLYHETFRNKNAIWGFSWGSEKFAILYSNRGLELVVLPSFPTEKLEELLLDIHQTLRCKSLRVLREETKNA